MAGTELFTERDVDPVANAERLNRDTITLSENTVSQAIGESKGETAAAVRLTKGGVKLEDTMQQRGSGALDKLGVRPVRDMGKYDNAEFLRGANQAQKNIKQELRKAVVRLDPTPGELEFSRGIANGLYAEANIPPNMSVDTVTELADYKPGKRWNPFFQSRVGTKTDYDIAKAYESYVGYMADVLYHTDDIARLRAVFRDCHRRCAHLSPISKRSAHLEAGRIKAIRYNMQGERRGASGNTER